LLSTIVGAGLMTSVTPAMAVYKKVIYNYGYAYYNCYDVYTVTMGPAGQRLYYVTYRGIRYKCTMKIRY